MNLRATWRKINLIAGIVLAVLIVRELQKSGKRWKAEQEQAAKQEGPATSDETSAQPSA